MLDIDAHMVLVLKGHLLESFPGASIEHVQ